MVEHYCRFIENILDNIFTVFTGTFIEFWCLVGFYYFLFDVDCLFLN